jgi:hypothetical protein
MESTSTIFAATLKEKKEHPELPSLVRELCFELSRKKIQKLKDEKNIHHRLGELFELYCKALHDEGLHSPEAVSHVIDGLLKAANHDKEMFLYKTIYEKEQLEKSIFIQKNHIRSTIAQTFDVLEEHIIKLQADTQDAALKALNDAKLKGVEMLGILKETAQEALLTTLEKGSDVQDTIYEITKNLTYHAINETTLNPTRILDISRTLLEASIEIANEDFGSAKMLIEGSVHGVKDGIAKAIDKFKNELKYSPDEAMEEMLETDLSSLRRELLKIDEQFIAQLSHFALHTEGMSRSLLNDMIAQMNSSAARIKRAANEAKEVISERIEALKEDALLFEKTFKDKAERSLETFKHDVGELEKKASIKIESLKQFEFESEKAKQMAHDAKKLGFRAWEVAKSMMDGALKGAKEAMKKEDK